MWIDRNVGDVITWITHRYMVFSALGTGPAFFYFLFSPRPTEAGEALTPPPYSRILQLCGSFLAFQQAELSISFFPCFVRFSLLRFLILHTLTLTRGRKTESSSSIRRNWRLFDQNLPYCSKKEKKTIALSINSFYLCSQGTVTVRHSPSLK